MDDDGPWSRTRRELEIFGTSSKMVVPEKRFAGGRGSRALTTEHKTAPSVTSTPGGCDKGDITRSVRARAATLRACYETQLVDKPDLSGRVTVQWTITGDGSVTGEKIIDDTLKNQAVTDCVLRAISQIKFIKPETGVCVLQWPFVFNPA